MLINQIIDTDIETLQLNFREKLLLMTMISYQDKYNRLPCSTNFLSDLTGISKRTVNKYLNHLVDINYIGKTQKWSKIDKKNFSMWLINFDTIEEVTKHSTL